MCLLFCLVGKLNEIYLCHSCLYFCLASIVSMSFFLSYVNNLHEKFLLYTDTVFFLLMIYVYLWVKTRVCSGISNFLLSIVKKKLCLTDHLNIIHTEKTRFCIRKHLIQALQLNYLMKIFRMLAPIDNLIVTTNFHF